MKCSKARFAVSLLIAASSGAQAQTVTGLGKWFDQQIANRITISGWRRLGYHVRTVSGDKQSYNDTEYSGQGLDNFTDLGQVHVNGTKVLGVLNFDLNIQDSRFTDPQANRVSLDFQKGPWSANLGDIRGSLASENRFARFDKSLTGAQLSYKSKRLQVRAIASEVRGQPRTVSVQGNNSSGPYYLQSSQIVRGSETIVVDGVQQKFGQDYIMDYELGSVSFVNRLTNEGRIIPPTSTIIATYEVFGFNGTKGRVQGANVTYDFGKVGKLGLTGMQQVQGVASRNSTYQEQYDGPIRSGATITLRNEPLDIHTVTVYIGSVLQTFGVDYNFNADNHSLFILIKPVPDKVVLTIIYTPRPVNTVQGDRSVIGLNYSFPLGKRGSLTYSQALGRLTNSPTASSGTARGVDFRYKTGVTEFTGSVRDVPIGYVSIETVGFSRNEKAQDLGIRVAPSERFVYGFNYRNSDISSISANSTVSRSKYSSANAFVNVTPQKSGHPWSFSQSHSSSSGLSGGSTVDTSSFGTSGDSGRMNWKLDLSNQFANGLVTVDNSQSRKKFTLQTLGYRMGYRASDAWNFDLNSSLSRIQLGSTSSIGRDLLFGFNFRPSDKFDVRGQVADSDAGQLATLGFIGGDSFGYDGNGFSSGAGASTFTNATNARTAMLMTNYAPTDRLSLNANINYYRSSGGVSSNTESVSYGIGANWQASKSTNLDFLIDTSSTSFIGSPLRSTATTLSLFGDTHPQGRFSARGGLNFLLTSGDSQFNQDSLGYQLELDYRLAKRHNLMFSMDNGSISGYQPQVSQNIGLTYQYQIWRSLALNIGYRIIDVTNRDSNITSGQYSSRGFDFELQFNFGR